ncbi:adenylate/guanylate cyclase domain-containing protein [Thermobispora bispora]|uniref:Adenylate/guanylate cyclase n=1 Tax=Thermobispora bispora (strain ATCC 19993 / DSM 43833 / CBS 139.67 / JCM 10125 / KCTC 9307 / NBRC 14880 / R51) TaxID=469371 RepID=D6Y5T3_THEBD|nr:adenylate/guanylate cyclase domain-containing protein [Thermobispora bispora]ADG87429.1 adenylate/guanylate cyclase [Thermobispora bispora DSM 43833]
MDTGGKPSADDVRWLVAGSQPVYTRRQVIEAAGVRPDFASRIWRALGFPAPADDAVAFSEADVAALRRVRAHLEAGLLDEQTTIRMARALGRTTARLAQWQAEIMTSSLLEQPGRPGEADLERVMETTRRLLPDFEQMLVHVWRSQLSVATSRLLSLAEGEEAQPGRPCLAVGFADLVAFTKVSRELDEPALAELVERFESRASDVIAAHGGRLVKTLGDEVLFTSDEPSGVASIALDLVSELKRDKSGPDVRIGLAYGPVVPLMGDVFGATVNLAARLTSIARPGTIIADAELAGALNGVAGFHLVRLRARPVRGVGTIRPYVLRRARPDRPEGEK